MREIGEMLVHNTMYVVTNIKMKCIGEIIWKRMVDIGKGGLGTLLSEKFLLASSFRLLYAVFDISLRRIMSKH